MKRVIQFCIEYDHVPFIREEDKGNGHYPYEARLSDVYKKAIRKMRSRGLNIPDVYKSILEYYSYRNYTVRCQVAMVLDFINRYDRFPTAGKKNEFGLLEHRLADYMAKSEVRSDPRIKTKSKEYFIIDYLTTEEVIDVICNMMDRIGRWPRQTGVPKSLKNTVDKDRLIEERMYYYLKSRIRLGEDAFFSKNGRILKYKHLYDLTKRIRREKKISRPYGEMFKDWCDTIKDYPRSKYCLKTSKLYDPRASKMAYLLICAFNPVTRSGATCNLTEDDISIIKEVSTNYGYVYKPGGLATVHIWMKKIRRRSTEFSIESFYAVYVPFCFKTGRIPISNSSDEDEIAAYNLMMLGKDSIILQDFNNLLEKSKTSVTYKKKLNSLKKLYLK